jgi:hypothetical protein
MATQRGEGIGVEATGWPEGGVAAAGHRVEGSGEERMLRECNLKEVRDRMLLLLEKAEEVASASTFGDSKTQSPNVSARSSPR